MKLKYILSSIVASAVAFGGIAIFSQLSFAQNNRVVYFCGKSREGIPTTYARTVTGKSIPLISWERYWSSEEDYTPEKRCQIVSNNFQKASEKGGLNYVTSGVVNNYNVICGTRRLGNPCETVLFTLRKQDNPTEVLLGLFAAASRAGDPIVQTEDGSPRYYYNVNSLIRQQSQSTTESK